jgi:hypothetical protein
VARLLFIENREKTSFWAAIARRLSERGHDIAWWVQNPLFARDLPGRVDKIPLPRRQDLDPHARPADFPALVTDRGREHFDAGCAHYAYYARRIEEIVDRESPDLVIGEPTLFHELLTIDLCERRGIAFAHPVGERYPPDRFAIFDGASQRPIIQSGETLPDRDALTLASNIAEGRSNPAYMARGTRLAALRARARWAATRGRVWGGRLAGERFNTPSLRRKRVLNRAARDNLARWRAAAKLPPVAERSILYPLQMQPENTIDVWGRPDFDQVAIVARLLAATPGDVTVALKANPKPYYELSDALLDLCLSHPRVSLLPVEMPMLEAYRHVGGAVTVTGTVGYEAVCGRGRCLSTSHPVLEDHFPDFTAPSIEAAALTLLRDPGAGRGSPGQGAKLMQHLTERSFDGVISDPVSDPRCMSPRNIETIAQAIALTIAHLARPARHRNGGLPFTAENR